MTFKRLKMANGEEDLEGFNKIFIYNIFKIIT